MLRQFLGRRPNPRFATARNPPLAALAILAACSSSSGDAPPTTPPTTTSFVARFELPSTSAPPDLLAEHAANGADLAHVLVVHAARGVVFPEGHKIAIVVTSGVATKSGVALSASPAFASLRDGARSSDPAKVYGDAIDAVVAKVGV